MTHATASRDLNLDEFLGHKSGGGRAGFLDWRDDGRISVVLHPSAAIAAVWSHNWHRIAEYEKKGKPVVEVKGMRWNCLEPEVILQNMRKRDDDDRRKFPPTVCPLCLMTEWVRDQVNDGKIGWVDPLFQFDAGRDDLVITAGGFCGLISRDKQWEEYTEDEQEDLKRAKIKLKEIYKENSFPRLQYLFSVVNVADPGAGTMLTFEAPALGDAVKKVIRDQIASLGREGDPRAKPYVIEWLYDDKQSFSDKYDARALMKVEINDDVRAILAQPPPETGDFVAPGNVKELRASMEEHCQIQGVPWDEIFGPAEGIAPDLQQEADKKGASTSFNYGANAKPEAPGSVAAAPSDEDEDVQCENCKGVMKLSQDTCPHCGVVYQADGSFRMPEPPKPAEPPKQPAMRTRGSVPAKAPTAAAPREAAAGAEGFRGSSRRA